MIVVKDLHKAFGEVKAVNGVLFEARDGEITGLLAPMGRAKQPRCACFTRCFRPIKAKS